MIDTADRNLFVASTAGIEFWPTTTFSAQAKDALAQDITREGLAAERLPDTLFVRSTAWIYMNEYPAGAVYHGGKPGGTKIISLEVNVAEGALDEKAKVALLASITAAVRKHAGLAPDALAPVYVIIREVQGSCWGFFGKPGSLDDLLHPPAGTGAF
jgi:phenylpyruvate tautomerase PptA (4-oxalocrotonate tautomerase family)